MGDNDTGESIGVVRSVRCNSDGTCMSLLSDRKAGAYLRTPDERIHVYNLDLAAVSSYDFGPSARYPVAHAWDPEEARLMVCETYKLLQPTSAKDNDGSSKNNDDDSSKDNKNQTKIKNKNGSTKSSEEKNDQNKKEEKTDDNE